MKYDKIKEIELSLDDISEIVQAAILYLVQPSSINDVVELFYSLLSIDESIEKIKNILEREFK